MKKQEWIVMYTPQKPNGWNLKITHLKRKIIFQTTILFGSHVRFLGVYLDVQES